MVLFRADPKVVWFLEQPTAIHLLNCILYTHDPSVPIKYENRVNNTN